LWCKFFQMFMVQLRECGFEEESAAMKIDQDW
jgi:hypothetical protein